MNVYDFDGTIYDGDSTVDFLIYMYRKHPGLMIPRLPGQCLAALRYKLGQISKERMKETFFSFLPKMPDVEKTVSDFWDEKEGRIKDWYKRQQREDDVIISASPEFLLKEICNRQGIRHLIATRMDERTGKIAGKNCRGEEKPVRFREVFPREEIEGFYSDHPSDCYMARLAREAYLVKGNELSRWKA